MITDNINSENKTHGQTNNKVMIDSEIVGEKKK